MAPDRFRFSAPPRECFPLANILNRVKTPHRRGKRELAQSEISRVNRRGWCDGGLSMVRAARDGPFMQTGNSSVTFGWRYMHGLHRGVHGARFRPDDPFMFRGNLT